MDKKRQNQATALFATGLLVIAGMFIGNQKVTILINFAVIVVCVAVGFFILSDEGKKD